VPLSEKRLLEAKKLGFNRAIIPPLPQIKTSKVYQPKDIATAIQLIS